MLDTDSVSFALRGEGQVGPRILEHRPSELCVSSITVAELRYGASRRNSAKLHQLIDTFTSNIAVVPFDEECAAHFGHIAGELAARGALIGEFDALIAAHAIALQVTLVTNNTKHFTRVRGLTVVNWA
ncbi:MAG TPA: type II toxin-antitoxin system VapC family toxin [Thermoanaerobaculia bacterium]|jgi:tRNA(fMet)-specific endonuclease VapC